MIRSVFSDNLHCYLQVAGKILYLYLSPYGVLITEKSTKVSGNFLKNVRPRGGDYFTFCVLATLINFYFRPLHGAFLFLRHYRSYPDRKLYQFSSPSRGFLFLQTPELYEALETIQFSPPRRGFLFLRVYPCEP